MGNLASLFKNCTCNVQLDEDETKDDIKDLKKEISIIKKKINKLETKMDIIETKIDNKFDLILLTLNRIN